MTGEDGKKTCKRLSEKDRLEIISKLSRPDPPSKRSIAREYDVSDGSVRKIWKQKEEIQVRSMLMSPETRARTFRQSKGNFPEVEERLFTWIDEMRQANVTVSPTLALTKAKQIAAGLLISEDDFKASWQWLQNFKKRKGLHATLPDGEGGEVDNNLSAKIDEDIEQVPFDVFDTLNKNLLAIEDQILCEEFQDEAGGKFDKIASHFLALKGLVRGVTRNVKRQRINRMWRSTY